MRSRLLAANDMDSGRILPLHLDPGAQGDNITPPHLLHSDELIEQVKLGCIVIF